MLRARLAFVHFADAAPNGVYTPLCAAQYAGLSDKTRKSLARLNESVVDYDLVEELVTHIHDTQGEGAILVFMPGIREARSSNRAVLKTNYASCSSGRAALCTGEPGHQQAVCDEAL